MVGRTILFYALLVIQIRLLGKRQLGQMEPTEFVVALLIADLASIALENPERPVWSGVIPIVVVSICERVLSILSLRSVRFRRILCGKPVILVENGRFLFRNLRRARITLDELSSHFRQQGILRAEDVQFAVLETNGAITAFPYSHLMPAGAKDAGIRTSAQELPCTLVSDGTLLADNLPVAGKTKAWVEAYLARKQLTLEDTLLLTVTPGGKICLIPRDSGENAAGL